jgi:drug/metabolite transporter (DMT)-like permease
MTADRPLLGIAFILGFCAVIPLGDATAKLLGASVPLVQVLLCRFGGQAIILLPVVALTGGSLMLPARILWLTFLRTILHVTAMGAFFVALRYLPLADATAITFVLPFILLLLGWLLMGEEVGPRRLAACTAGFVGTLLVIQPSFAVVGWPALLPLVVALIFACFMLLTRRIAKEADAIALQAVSGLMATGILLAGLALGMGSDLAVLEIVWPTPREALLLAAVGVFGTVGHLLLTWALRFAPSATIAPIQYLEIPVATLVGWAVFGDLPNGLAAFGIAVTMSAGLYIVFRERTIARSLPVK